MMIKLTIARWLTVVLTFLVTRKKEFVRNTGDEGAFLADLILGRFRLRTCTILSCATAWGPRPADLEKLNKYFYGTYSPGRTIHGHQ